MEVHIINYSAPKYVDGSGVVVDLDIETEEYGWIPTTIILDDTDTQEHIIQIKAWLNANKSSIAPYVELMPSLTELLALKTRYIEKERAKSLAEHEGNATTPDGLVWQTDPTSMSELNNALTTFTVFGGTPEGFVWRDANNVNHPATLQFLAGIAMARAVQVQSIWTRSWQLKASLQSAYDSNNYEAMMDLIW